MAMKRVQVNLTEEMIERIDKIRKQYGVTRSALCAMFIGQMVDGTEKGVEIARNLMQDENFIANIVKKTEQ